MEQFDALVVGAGPAGLGAAIELGRWGIKTALLDENNRPGGQLFKQIHKFFGSREHMAGVRGFSIGERLLAETCGFGVEIRLNTRVWGIFPGGRVSAVQGAAGPEGTENKSLTYKAKKIILATGASENPLAFPGSTLPGVMTAGAAQTLMNIYHVLPGKEIVIVGSGNVGLIVAYQLLQAKARVKAIVEALPRLSGYSVHAGKVRRAGVPILLSHTVKCASGGETLRSVTVHKLDSNMKPVSGTDKDITLDTLCVAVGLSPRIELAGLCGCKHTFSPVLGGLVPLHNEDMETSAAGVLIAGDLSGIEEASTALDEGRLAGLCAAEELGLGGGAIAAEKEKVKNRLAMLRRGPFGEKRRDAKKIIWERASFERKPAGSL